jgi:rod shape determining protein RodA
MMFGDLKIRGSDYSLLILVCLLIAIGLTAIYSASYQAESAILKSNFAKQILWFFISVILLVFTVIIPLRFYWLIAYWLYILAIGLLFITLFFHPTAEVHRWIDIGPFKFQPAEFAKICVLLAICRYLSEDRRDLSNLKEMAIAFAIILVPFLIVVKQPDLGTALVFMSLILPIMYWAGLPTYLLFVVVAPFLSLLAAFNYYTFLILMIVVLALSIYFRRGLKFVLFNLFANISVGIIPPFLWAKLHGYQQHRILTFLGLKLDPQGAGYQVIQSKVAIGSGGFLGKGFLNGTQTQLRFLPAQHTDFVFSVIGEEFGFVGVCIVILLFYIMLLRGIHVASMCRSKFASLLVIGIVTIIGFHAIVSIGMTAGIMPVTGIPLPFISYGGSSLMANMILIGLIINASIRRLRY